MTIWQYADHIQEKEHIEVAAQASNCLFCATPLEKLRNEREDRGKGGEYETTSADFWTCPICGWWKARKEHHYTDFGFQIRQVRAAAAALCNLDLSDLSAPLDEVRNFLSAKYGARFDVHPRKFELLVASVFRDHGFSSVATGYSNDAGIDVILEDSSNRRIGVQVKRYKNSIDVEQIRSLVGALCLGGYTKGIFVTTSTFQRGAPGVALQSAVRGMPIQLMDAEAFFHALKIAQREKYKTSGALQTSVEADAFMSISSFFHRRRV